MPSITELETRIELLLAENQRLIKAQNQAQQQHEKEILQARQEVQKAQEIATSAQAAKANFLGSISHELYTPLNTILGLCQVLLGEQSLSKAQRETLLLIMQSGEYLLNLIKEILKSSDGESHQFDLQITPFDLDEILARLEEAQVKSEASTSEQLESKLATLPAEIQIALYNALIQYSLTNVELVCLKIANLDASIAEEIVQMAKDFDFKTLLNLLPK